MGPLQLVALVSLLFILCLCIGIAYSFIPASPEVVYLTCEPGRCATNLYNGEKRCPDVDTVVTYSPAYETCSSRYVCDNKNLPYALLPDGSTNAQGVCQAGDTCRCLSRPRCSYYTTTVFEVGDDGLNSQAGRAVLIQNPAHQGSNVVMQYDNPGRQLCEIRANHLSRLSPNACILEDEVNPTSGGVLGCMNTNPCLSGVLAFKVKDHRVIGNATDLLQYPLACVQGERTNGFRAFDTTTNELVTFDFR